MIKYFICIPNYNHSAECVSLVDKIISQYDSSEKDYEIRIIICDDKSSQPNLNRLRNELGAIQSTSIVLIEHKENKSCLQARISCMKYIAENYSLYNNYVINLDPDDTITDDFFEVLDKNTSIYDTDVIITDLICIRDNAEFLLKIDNCNYGSEISNYNSSTQHSIVGMIIKSKLLNGIISMLDGFSINLCEDLTLNLAIRSLMTSSTYSIDKFYVYLYPTGNSICTDKNQMIKGNDNRLFMDQLESFITGFTIVDH